MIIRFEKGNYVGSKKEEHIFGHVMASETVFTPSMSSAWHYHANPHFSHILAGGSKEVRKEGSALQQPGTGFYYYPGVVHQNVDYRPGTRIFNLEPGEDFFREYELPLPPPSLMNTADPLLNTGLVRIMKEYYLRDNHSSLAIDQLCIELMKPPVKKEKLFPEWASKIKVLMHDRWDATVTLSEMGKELHLHPVSISRYFPHYFGCSAGEYLRRIKVERALGLIAAQQHSLTDIAYRCGFTDQAHFIRTFRRITGFLPKQYRLLLG